MYRFSKPLIEATLIKRYKRFLADVVLANGISLTVHCPNTGAMTGCARVGARAWLSESDNPKRKYRHTWEFSSDTVGHKIGVNTINANRVIGHALRERTILPLQHYSHVQSEVKHGESRIDFVLQEDGAPDAYVEVKSVTLVHEEDPTHALFPDAVSKRGQKHGYELAKIAQSGHLAFLVFCIQRENITQFSIAKEIDPDYAKAIEYAKENGVKVLAYACEMSEIGIGLSHAVEIS
ncbi:DNA/RNA nuclease SfsA [Ningiella sp. W23]|uniref:DNA/RNA nuclease SfsA n=1 Tax=Ningiella sp. W23 TaxID=3023715 RepID=UPI0037574CE6